MRIGRVGTPGLLLVITLAALLGAKSAADKPAAPPGGGPQEADGLDVDRHTRVDGGDVVIAVGATGVRGHIAIPVDVRRPQCQLRGDDAGERGTAPAHDGRFGQQADLHRR